MKRPRGTRDFLPPEMAARRNLEQRLRDIAVSFGFGEVQTPVFEDEELFTIRSGDAVVEELYNFTDKGGRKLSLRPEITAPVMRMYVSDLQFSPKPIKLFYFSNAFRYERPQSGRYREFWQFGAEIIGAEGMLATAECIAMAVEMVREAGVPDPVLRVGHIGVLKKLLEESGIDEKYHNAILHLVDKREVGELDKTLSALGKQQLMETINALLASVNDLESATSVLSGEAGDCAWSLMELMRMLEWMGVGDVVPDLAVVRGLDYYTGVVFEIDAPGLGAEKQVCGGGEYRLAHLFGGSDTNTVGFALGFDRLLLAAGKGAEEPNIDYYVISVGGVVEQAVRIATSLRKKGHRVDMDLMGRNVKKSMKYAASRNSLKAIIVGPKDLEKGQCTIHDMDTGEDAAVSLDSLLE